MTGRVAETIANQVFALRPKLQKITIDLEQRYTLDDVRAATFNNLQGIVIHTFLMHNMFSAFEKGWVDSRTSQMMFGFDVRQPAAEDALNNMVKYEKLLFPFFVNFNVENFSKIILQKLQGRNPPEGFYKIVDELLGEIKITDHANKLRILNTMAVIRNALHSNGVHTKQDIPAYSIAGQAFEFKRGKPVDCASWPSMCVVLDNIADILLEVVESPAVRNITQTLPWQFYPL